MDSSFGYKTDGEVEVYLVIDEYGRNKFARGECKENILFRENGWREIYGPVMITTYCRGEGGEPVYLCSDLILSRLGDELGSVRNTSMKT